MTALRAVIAEDSALVREGIARLLTDAGYDVVAKVGDADALILAVEQLQPDIVRRESLGGDAGADDEGGKQRASH